MAEAAEVAIEALGEIIDALTAEGAPEELLASLTELEDANQGIGAVMQQQIEDGTPVEDAIKNAYNTISDVSPDAADAWAENMVEEGYEFPKGNEEEIEDFKDTSADSDPDKGELDDPECPDDSTDPDCLLKKQGKLTRFLKFMKQWGAPIGTVLVATATAVYIFIGQIARWICQLIQKIKGTCKGSVDPQCIDNKCDSTLCTAAKDAVTWTRKYLIPILCVVGIVTAALTIYFKSVTPLIFGGIAGGGVFILSSVLGNLAATVLCDVGASTCLFLGKPINC